MIILIIVLEKNTEKNITYYAQTMGGSKNTDIKIINNIRRTETQ